MAIVANDLKIRKAATDNDGNTNGGRMTSTAVTSGQSGGFFPPVSQAERTAGITRYRKRFAQNCNQTIALQAGRVFLRKQTPATGTRCTMSIGTATGTYADDLPGAERQYGAGALNAEVFPAGTTLVVDCETGSAADQVFQNGDYLVISNGTDYEQTTATTVIWAGEVATITVPALAGNWPAGSIVSSAYPLPADLEATSSGWTESSAAGTYDETTYPVTCNNLGSIDADWTLTFTSPTAFTCTSNTGLSFNGSTAGAFSPTNSGVGVSYFTLSALGWGGTWAIGDTVAFSTTSASVPVWLRLVVTAGSAAYDPDSTRLSVIGES